MEPLTILLFVTGILFLAGGGEILVRGASRLAALAGISPLIIGLTVVSFGTSAPELAVNLQSSFTGQAEIALGNVVGSNILNVLLILGLSAAITPLVVSQQLVRLDVPIMIAASFLMLVLGLDGAINRLDGALLFTMLVAYLAFLLLKSRRDARLREKTTADIAAIKTEDKKASSWGANLALIAAGLLLLVIGSRWLVSGATAFARLIGVSELVIGLTVVSMGTSLPEVATSVIASMRGEKDIAVGNVVGSNLFNILTVLGLSGLVSPHGIPISDAVLGFDIPVMIAVAIACLPIFFTGYTIDRWEGWLFLGFYLAYTFYLMLNSTEHDLLPVFNKLMIMFVIPITALTLLVLSFNAFRSKSSR